MGVEIEIPEAVDFMGQWAKSDNRSIFFARNLPSPEISRFRIEPVGHLVAGERAARLPLAVDTTLASAIVASTYAKSGAVLAERSLWWIIDRERDRSKLGQLDLASEQFKTYEALAARIETMEDRDVNIPLTVTYRSELPAKSFRRIETLHYDHETRRLTINHDGPLSANKDVCDEIKVLSGRLVEWLGARTEGGKHDVDDAIRRLDLTIGAVQGDPALAQAIRDFSHFAVLFLEDRERFRGYERRERADELRGRYDALERERKRFCSGIPPPSLEASRSAETALDDSDIKT